MNYRMVQKQNWMKIRTKGVFKYSFARTISVNIGIFFGVLLSLYFDVLVVIFEDNYLMFFLGKISILKIDFRFLVGIIIVSLILIFYCFKIVFRANEKRYNLIGNIEYPENI